MQLKGNLHVVQIPTHFMTDLEFLIMVNPDDLRREITVKIRLICRLCNFLTMNSSCDKNRIRLRYIYH